MADVTMPQLGETVADGTVTKWFKKVGETVVRGEPLFEVSTDKVDTEIPAQHDGVLSAILVGEGVTVDVGTRLAVIGADDSTPETSSNEPSSSAAAPVPSGAARASTTLRANEGHSEKLSPVVRRLLAEYALEQSEVTGTCPKGRITREDVLEHVANSKSAPAPAVALSPVVRRLLAEHQLDAARLTGTGPEGRLTRRDVVAFSKIRRLTAEHMVMSKATSDHTLMVREVDYERVDIVRRTFGPDFKQREGFSLTYLPFNALAALEALREFPNLNASVGNDELIIHHDLNLGIAVDRDGDGLVVPVVHCAGQYGLRSIARRIRELATAARTKKLTVDHTANGTFTITNPGPFGTLITGAVITQPQVAILSTDGVTRVPVVVNTPDGGESIAIHSMGMLALTFDHRAVDGAYAARFLQRMAQILNTRDW